MDAHPFGATLGRRPVQRLIGLLMLFNIMKICCEADLFGPTPQMCESFG